VADAIAAVRGWIAALKQPELPYDRAIVSQARAVAENAHGRAKYLLGKRDDAVSAFDRALSFAPGLGDAHVNMASALFWARARYADWNTRISLHLDRALEVSPNDRKALYLRGKLYYLLNQKDDAKRVWEQASEAGDEWAQFRLGEMLWEGDDEESKAQAIELVRRSQARNPVHDERARALVLWTADVADDGKVEQATLIAARQAGKEIEQYEKGRDRPLGKELREAIDLINAKANYAPAGRIEDALTDD
jgi:tetratricopeptide (TPR) repeat protein